MKKSSRRTILLLVCLLLVIAACLQSDSYSIVLDRIKSIIVGKKTVADRIIEFESKITPRLEPIFRSQGLSYPPEKVILVFLKNEKKLRIYAGEPELKFVKEYSVLAASGGAGPKLKEGDNQVPEGIYKIEALNPNSIFHLSLRTNYPNDFDKKMAAMDGRENLGSDIMIHGHAVSIGCLAIGNEAIEELFILAALSKWQTWEIIIAPHDLRSRPRDRKADAPKWISQLDSTLIQSLNSIPK